MRLTQLAGESGGESFFPSEMKQIDQAYERILSQIRAQYSLGYVSTNKRHDGRWRRVVVRTPERDDLQIRHKIGYFAPKPERVGSN